MSKRKAEKSREDQLKELNRLKRRQKEIIEKLSKFSPSNGDDNHGNQDKSIEGQSSQSKSQPTSYESPPDLAAAIATKENVEAGVTKLVAKEPEFTQPMAVADPATTEGIDPEHLSVLESRVTESSNISIYLEECWSPILKEGLPKEKNDDIKKKHSLPNNCPLLKAPMLNSEISKIKKHYRDNNMEMEQNQLGLALAIIGKAMTGIIKKSIEPTETFKLLSDSAKLIADLHFSETRSRQRLVLEDMRQNGDSGKEYEERKRNEYLFDTTTRQSSNSTASRYHKPAPMPGPSHR